MRREYHVIPGNSDGWWRAYCNAGERATGGGGYFDSIVAGDSIIASRPVDPALQATQGAAPVGWLVYAHNADASTRTLQVAVVCVPS